MKERSRPLVRMTIACLFFLTAVALNILLPRYWHNIPEIVKHRLLLFSAIMCVHMIEYAYLWWEIFGHIKSILKETLQATHQLIDALRSSAIFRTLLESATHEAAKIVNTDSAKTQATDDPYFHQRLYSDFTHVCDRRKSYPNIGTAVRFYTHTPTCDWRKFPCQTWEWNQPPLNVCLQNRKAIIKATICNFSHEGLSLKLEATTLPILRDRLLLYKVSLQRNQLQPIS